MDSIDSREVLERIMDRMVLAGWLERWVFTEGKGFHLTWSKRGAGIAMTLREIIESHGLDADDRSAVLFCKLSKGESLGEARLAFIPEENVLAFWYLRADELDLSSESDFLGLVHIIKVWG